MLFTQTIDGNPRFWGLFCMNANAMDVQLRISGGAGHTQASLSLMMSGGVADLYLFIDLERPEEVVRAYHRLIGKPMLPPFWSLGWH